MPKGAEGALVVAAHGGVEPRLKESGIVNRTLTLNSKYRHVFFFLSFFYRENAYTVNIHFTSRHRFLLFLFSTIKQIRPLIGTTIFYLSFLPILTK